MDNLTLNTLSQIVSSMEEAVIKLERAYENKNAEGLEHAKRIILEFQKRLSEELGEK